MLGNYIYIFHRYIKKIIEKPTFPYNKFSILERLIVRDLPRKCECLSKYLGHNFVEPIYDAEGLNWVYHQVQRQQIALSSK